MVLTGRPILSAVADEDGAVKHAWWAAVRAVTGVLRVCVVVIVGQATTTTLPKPPVGTTQVLFDSSAARPSRREAHGDELLLGHVDVVFGRVVLSLQPRVLNDDGNALAASDARGTDGVLAAGLDQSVRQVRHDARTRRSQRVAQRDRATVHVRLVAEQSTRNTQRVHGAKQTGAQRRQPHPSMRQNGPYPPSQESSNGSSNGTAATTQRVHATQTGAHRNRKSAPTNRTPPPLSQQSSNGTRLR